MELWRSPFCYFQGYLPRVKWEPLEYAEFFIKVDILIQEWFWCWFMGYYKGVYEQKLTWTDREWPARHTALLKMLDFPWNWQPFCFQSFKTKNAEPLFSCPWRRVFNKLSNFPQLIMFFMWKVSGIPVILIERFTST